VANQSWSDRSTGWICYHIKIFIPYYRSHLLYLCPHICTSNSGSASQHKLAPRSNTLPQPRARDHHAACQPSDIRSGPRLAFQWHSARMGRADGFRRRTRTEVMQTDGTRVWVRTRITIPTTESSEQHTPQDFIPPIDQEECGSRRSDRGPLSTPSALDPHPQIMHASTEYTQYSSTCTVRIPY
jgi:hypothetical protein